eukprot:1159576-Pelagomonas_calceolata.AAC.7
MPAKLREVAHSFQCGLHSPSITSIYPHLRRSWTVSTAPHKASYGHQCMLAPYPTFCGAYQPLLAQRISWTAECVPYVKTEAFQAFLCHVKPMRAI